MSSSTLKEIDGLKKKKSKELEKGNLKEVADLCNELGEALHRAGQLWDAIEQHEEERQYCEALSDHLGVAFAHRKIGECHFDLGEYSKALRHQKQHLEIAEQQTSNVEQQRALATIGRTYFQHASEVEDRDEQKHLLRKAESAYLQSLEKCEVLRGHIDDTDYQEMKTRLLLNIGLVFQEYDDHPAKEDARKYVLKSLTMAKRSGLKEDIYRAAFSLADMCVTSDMRQAEEYVQTALDMAGRIRSKEMQRDAMAVKAKICLHGEKFMQAKHLWKKIYKMTPAKSDPDAFALAKSSVLKAARLEHAWSQLSSSRDDDSRLPLLGKCAHLLIDLTAPAAAVKLLQQQSEVAETVGLSATSLAPMSRSLADALHSLNRYEEAAKSYLNEAQQWGVSNASQAWKAYQSAAECEELQGSEASSVVDIYNQALDMAQQAKNSRIEKAILRELVDFHKQQGNEESEKSSGEQLSAFGDSQDTDDEEEEESQEEESEQAASEESESDISISHISDTDTSKHEEEFDRGSAKDRLNRQRWEKKRNGKGETPLHLACIKGELGRVRFLIKTGHPLTMRDYAGWLPLHEACSHGHGDVVLCLLEHGADKDARGDQDTTPLIDACSAGHLHIAHLLLDHGADASLRDKRGSTAVSALRALRADSLGELTADDLRQIRNMERRLLVSTGHARPEDHSEEEVEVEEDSEVQQPRPRVSTSGNPIQDDTETQGEEEEGSERILANPYCTEEPVVAENPHKAPHLYREVMQSLRSSTTTMQESTRRSSRKTTGKSSPPPALIRADEAAGDDDWIEDDLGRQPRSKRRRTQVDGYLYGNTAWNESRHQRHSSSSSSPTKRKKSNLNTAEKIMESEGESEDQEVMEGINNENRSPNISQTAGNDRLTDETALPTYSSSDEDVVDLVNVTQTLSTARTKPPTQRHRQRSTQLRLTDFTVHTHEHNDRPLGIIDTADSLMTPTQPAANIGISSESALGPRVGGVRRIQVKIQDKTLMVPVQPDTNVGVLASEAAARYYKLCAVRPRLSLRTRGGAVLLDDDMVADLLQNDEEVDGIVDSWELQPLKSRYTQACADLNTNVYKDVEAQLCEGTVSLSGLSLSSLDLQPLSRALHCHTTLSELRLSGVGLRDSDIQQLPVSTLTALRTLDLSANRLSHVAVHKLGESLQATPLQSVQSLDVSHSRLSELAGTALCVLLEGLPGLRQLRVSCCQLQQHTLHGQHRARLKTAMADVTEVDVSYNRGLGVLGCELLLHCLNPACVRILDLSATVLTYTNDLLPNHLTLFVSQPADCALEKLYLNNCCLIPHQIARFASFLSHCPKLQHLSINTNPRLSYHDIGDLLTSVATLSHSSVQTIHAVTGSNPAAAKKPTTADEISADLTFPGPLKELWLGPGLESKDRGALEASWRSRWGQERARVTVTNSGVIKLAVRDSAL